MNSPPQNEPRPTAGVHFASWLQCHTEVQDLQTQASGFGNPNNLGQESSQPVAESTVRKRRRGRPRVATLRDESAIEKRRAQVRKAQRTYQQRKDNNAKAANHRHDEILKVLSDLSGDIEELLAVVAKAGILDNDDEMSSRVRRLWDSYNVAMHRECIMPELKQFQIKNDQRRAHYLGAEGPTTATSGAPEASPLSAFSAVTEPSNMDISLIRGNSTTLIQSFRPVSSESRVMGGRSILEVIAERQAEFR